MIYLTPRFFLSPIMRTREDKKSSQKPRKGFSLMRCNIHGDHMVVTPALSEYVENKVSRLEKFDLLTASDECRVTLRVTKKRHTAEMTIPTPGAIFRAEESTEDMYASVDLVIDKLNRQIRKYKNRLENRNRQLLTSPPEAFAEEPAEAQESVVRIKRFEYKPMSVDEAILQMDLLGHNFFVFSNAETNQVSVVYKRNDGGFGLIEPSV